MRFARKHGLNPCAMGFQDMKSTSPITWDLLFEVDTWYMHYTNYLEWRTTRRTLLSVIAKPQPQATAYNQTVSAHLLRTTPSQR